MIGKQEKGNRVPLIHQETNELLFTDYEKENRKEIKKLKGLFAEAIYETAKHFGDS